MIYESQSELIARNIVIMPARLLREHRIELLRIKIEQVDVVTCMRERGQRGRTNCRMEALGQWMTINIEYAHDWQT